MSKSYDLNSRRSKIIRPRNRSYHINWSRPFSASNVTAFLKFNFYIIGQEFLVPVLSVSEVIAFIKINCYKRGEDFLNRQYRVSRK